jgi:serine/threonine protein phosphatase PrpC
MSRYVSAGTSDAGNVRGNNEDRVYIDAERGIYLVVDGMGGQAAGEEAAEIAVKTIRGRLERPTETPEQRVREAIALANNAIYEAASHNTAWKGMACVLTLALIEDGHAVLGHVGDSRAYQIHGGKIEKITRDHSPVGEREDSGELTEEAAMNHPRRNEVYRDVGSAPRTPDDADFIDVATIPLPKDGALLLCSDGLSDVVPSRRILQAVEENAADCDAAVRILVRAAVADGKDNVSVVLVEGESFAKSVKPPMASEITRAPEAPVAALPVNSHGWFGGRAMFFLIGLALGSAAWWAASADWQAAKPAQAHAPKIVHVAPTGGDYPSIPESLSFVASGDTIEVAPGVYPEKILLKDGITIRAARSGEATIGGGVISDAVKGAVLRGFKIGDFGVELNSSNVRLESIETEGPVIFAGASTGAIRASKLDSLIVRDSSSPEVDLNYIDSDVEWLSTAPLRLSGNGIQGELLVRAAPAPDLFDNNVFALGKKAIHIAKPGGAMGGPK